MRKIFAFLILVLVGCSNDYSHEVEQGLEKIKVVKEFNSTFPNSMNKIAYEGGPGDAQLVWASKVGIHNRYILSMIFDVRIDESSRTPIPIGSPRIGIQEIKEVQQIDSILSVTFAEGKQRDISLEEWTTLVESNGDFSKIDYEIVVGSPVPQFNKALEIP